VASCHASTIPLFISQHSLLFRVLINDALLQLLYLLKLFLLSTQRKGVCGFFLQFFDHLLEVFPILTLSVLLIVEIRGGIIIHFHCTRHFTHLVLSVHLVAKICLLLYLLGYLLRARVSSFMMKLADGWLYFLLYLFLELLLRYIN
jgi:hypothetical protein